MHATVIPSPLRQLLAVLVLVCLVLAVMAEINMDRDTDGDGLRWGLKLLTNLREVLHCLQKTLNGTLSL